MTATPALTRQPMSWTVGDIVLLGVATLCGVVIAGLVVVALLASGLGL